MALISRQSIEEIRSRVNIFDVVSPYVQLRKVGGSYRGLSPFNPEKTPSFYVHPDRGFFKCFSSGQGGDLFKFVQLLENLEFQEAVETIADRFNIPLQYEAGGETGPPRSLRNEVLAIQDEAAEFFSQCFWDSSPLGDKIRHYWVQDRRFTEETARDFRIGLAPPDGRLLLAHLKKKNFGIEALRECGLFFKSENLASLDQARPRFLGRLMIPIHDIQGRVIAFTARQLDMTPERDPTRDAKYVNSPETPVFHKSDVLFGLDRARKHIDQTGFFVMVEGQLDAIRCHATGINTAVAPQGTGITEQQLSRLQRFHEQIYVLLDGDKAGRDAALRMLPIALKVGLEPKFLLLEPGGDPDDLLADGGNDAWESLRKQAKTGVSFAVRALLGSANPQQAQQRSAREKAAALENIYEMLAETQSNVVKDEYLLQAAHDAGVDIVAVQRDFQAYLKRRHRFSKTSPNPPAPRDPDEEIPDNFPNPSARKMHMEGSLTSAEEALLYLIFHYEQYGKTITQSIDPQWINASSAGNLLQKVLAEFEHDEWAGVDDLRSLIESDQESNLISALLIREPPAEDFNPIPHIEAARKRLFDRFYEHEVAAINQKLVNLQSEDSQTTPLMQRLIDLRKLRANFKSAL